MGPYFFRVEHDLLRSDAFKTLGGSAIKVYLVIGLYSDFGTDWAYPSIRTIARQAGLSRQTVMTAIEDLTRAGLLAASRSKGRSTAYRVLRQPVPTDRPSRAREAKPGDTSKKPPGGGPKSFLGAPPSGQNILEVPPESGPKSLLGEAQFLDRPGHGVGPKRDPDSKDEETATIPIPGTPFRLTAEGRLLVAVDLQELLTNQGIPRNLAGRLVAQKDPEAVAKVLLNAFYLQSQGKLQNGPGYIRAGIEDGYDLLPQVANRLEGRRRELEAGCARWSRSGSTSGWPTKRRRKRQPSPTSSTSSAPPRSTASSARPWTCSPNRSSAVTPRSPIPSCVARCTS